MHKGDEDGRPTKYEFSPICVVSALCCHFIVTRQNKRRIIQLRENNETIEREERAL